MILLKKNIICFWITLLFLFTSFLALSTELHARGSLSVTSPDFDYGAQIPAKSDFPTLIISNIPPKTRSFVIQMIDLDRPFGRRLHWLVANIPPSCRILSPRTFPQEAVIGKNDFGYCRYDGPSFPSHIGHYLINVFALDIVLPLDRGFSYQKLQGVMWGHIIEKAALMGTYSGSL